MMVTFNLSNSVPVLVLGSAITAFGGWIAYDSTTKPVPTKPTRHAGYDFTDGTIQRGPTAEDVLVGIRIGLHRMKVESSLAILGNSIVEPIDVTSGDPVIRIRLRVHLNEPVPHMMRQHDVQHFRAGPYMLTLDFDGLIQGHPLTNVSLKPL